MDSRYLEHESCKQGSTSIAFRTEHQYAGHRNTRELPANIERTFSVSDTASEEVERALRRALTERAPERSLHLEFSYSLKWSAADISFRAVSHFHSPCNTKGAQ